METEQPTYGIAEWAAALRAKRTEEELAALRAERAGVALGVQMNVITSREGIEAPTTRYGEFFDSR